MYHKENRSREVPRSTTGETNMARERVPADPSKLRNHDCRLTWFTPAATHECDCTRLKLPLSAVVTFVQSHSTRVRWKISDVQLFLLPGATMENVSVVFDSSATVLNVQQGCDVREIDALFVTIIFCRETIAKRNGVTPALSNVKREQPCDVAVDRREAFSDVTRKV